MEMPQLDCANYTFQPEEENQLVEILQKWLKQQPHLAACPTDPRFLLKYLRGCKYNIEKSERKIEMALTLRSLLPELYTGWDPTSPEIQAVLDYGGNLPLPGHDHLGRKVIVIRMAAHDPMKIRAELVHKVSFMVWNVVFDEEEQMFTSGVVLIFDLDGFSMDHFIGMPIALAVKIAPCWEDANPLRPKSMNYVRTPAIFQAFNALFSRFVNDKMKKRVKFHGNKFESLYEEVNKEILPKEYGGDGPSFSELTEYWKKKLVDRREWLIEQEKIKSNEHLRPAKPKTSADLFGIEGSFRQLQID